MMLGLLSAFGGTEIAIVTVLAVALIVFVAADGALIARAKKNKKNEGEGERIVYVPVPTPVPEEQNGEPMSETENGEPMSEEQPAEEQKEPPMPVVLAVSSAQQEEAYNRLRLDRSFTAKLVQTEDEIKGLYAELKRELLSYSGVRSRMSWKRETFRRTHDTLARFGVRGKTLCLYLALDPNDYADSKFKAEDASDHSSFVDTPLLYRIKNPLRMRYAKELIAILMESKGIARGEADETDHLSELAYRSTPALIDEGLIRVPEGMELPAFEPVAEAAEIAPAEAEPAEETAEAESMAELPAEEPAEEPVPADVPAETGSDAESLQFSSLYDRSFRARIIQADEETKEWYSMIKNELLSYRKVNCRESWKRESYTCRRRPCAKIIMRGRTLCLLLPLDLADYEGSTYKLEDASAASTYRDTPALYRIKNPRRAKLAIELIAEVMNSLGIERTEQEPVDYAEPYCDTETLIQRELIKLIGAAPAPFLAEKPAAEAAETAPAEAEHAEETAKTELMAELPAEEPAEEPVPEEVVEEPASEETVPEEPTVGSVPEALSEEPESVMVPMPSEEEDDEDDDLPYYAFYIRSFRARLIHLDDDAKRWYSDLKNELLSYKKMRSRESWKHESFHLGRNACAVFVVRGNTLCLYLALNAADYEGTKYKLEDASVAAYRETPALYRIVNSRRAKYACDLIRDAMEKIGAKRILRDPVDYYEPYLDTGTMIEMGLIKYADGTSLVPPPPFRTEEASEHAVSAAHVVSASLPEADEEDEIAEADEAAEAEITAEADEEAKEPIEEPAEGSSPEETVEETVPEEIVEEPAPEETVPEGPTEEPVPEGPIEEPVLEEPVEEPTVEPVSEEIVEEPVPEEVIEEPVPEEPVPEEPVPEEVIEEPAPEEPAEEPVPEEPIEEPVPEETVEESVPEEPVEEPVLEEVIEEPVPEETVEESVPEEPIEEPVPAEVVEELAPAELVEEPEQEERMLSVVGVMFRRRGRKTYYFDPDGKTWTVGETAFYTSPDGVRSEVVVVEVIRKREEELHLPLKPLEKA